MIKARDRSYGCSEPISPADGAPATRTRPDPSAEATDSADRTRLFFFFFEGFEPRLVYMASAFIGEPGAYEKVGPCMDGRTVGRHFGFRVGRIRTIGLID